MPEENKQETVSKDVYLALLKKLEEARTENEAYRSKSPLVGIRWFGDGGFGAPLTYPISGVNKLLLNGYGDKGVMDNSTWVRLRKGEHAGFGLLVRDDSVIEELGVVGAVAPPDPEKDISPNSFTPAQAREILTNYTLPKFKGVVRDLTSHWGAIHLIREAEALIDEKIKIDLTRVSYLKERRDYLQSEFRFSLMHPHDMRACCEQYGIRNWEDMQVEEMIEALTNAEIEMLTRE